MGSPLTLVHEVKLCRRQLLLQLQLMALRCLVRKSAIRALKVESLRPCSALYFNDLAGFALKEEEENTLTQNINLNSLLVSRKNFEYYVRNDVLS